MFQVASFMSRSCVLVTLSKLSYRRFVLTTKCWAYFLYVEQRDGGSWYEAAVAPELVYPPVSWVGL